MILSTPCIETTRPRNHSGYGVQRAKRFGVYVTGAHRVAWVDHYGRLPLPGMHICHHCDNPPCVNVEHLYEGTPKQNSHDMVRRGRAPKCRAGAINKSKTCCPKGHEYTKENTYIWRGWRTSALGERVETIKRYCLTCRPNIERERRARRTTECRREIVSAILGMSPDPTAIAWPLTPAQRQILDRCARRSIHHLGLLDARTLRSLVRRGLIEGSGSQEWELTEAGQLALDDVKRTWHACPVCERPVRLKRGFIAPHGCSGGNLSTLCPGSSRIPVSNDGALDVPTCGYGHRMTPGNIYVQSRTGKRQCRECRRRRDREAAPRINAARRQRYHERRRSAEAA